MNEPDPLFALLRDSRLAPYAVSPGAAWLWSADGSRIHFANAVGAAVFGAASPAALLARRFSSTDPLAKQIARLAETLLPLLLLPVVAPVMLGATRAFEAGLGLSGSVGDAWPWVELLALFAVIYTTLGFLAFGSLLEEA